MKFGAIDRILQLGVTPSLTEFLKKSFPGVSASLWQRQAKTNHRRILDGIPDVPDGAFSHQAHGALSLCCLLVAFHVAAPAEAKVSRELFDELVCIALKSPALPIALGVVDYSSQSVANDVESALRKGLDSDEAGMFAGSLRAVGDQAGRACFACSVSRCGLVKMLVQEKRFYLLESLCRVEEFQAALSGGTLERTSCIAKGDRTCEMRILAGEA